MKVILVLVAFVTFVSAKRDLPVKIKAIIRGNAEACARQEGITKEQGKSLHEGRITNPDVKVKCFVNCFLEKFGFFVNGQYKPDVILAKLGPIVGKVKLKAIQAKCTSVTGTDKCDTAFQIYRCYYKNSLEPHTKLH